MNKIIAALDGLKYSEATRDYAIHLAKRSGAHLVGVFLDDFTYHSYKIYDLIVEDAQVIASNQKSLEKKDMKARATAVQNFEDACQDQGLAFTLHRDRKIAIQEILHESVFADLLVIDSRETLSHHPEKPPTHFIRDLLAHVQCPVVVVPHKFRPIEKLVLLYDGAPSSMYAIKMLGYTLGKLPNLPVEVVSVNVSKQEKHVPNNLLIKEYMKRHFESTSFTVVNGIPEAQIVNYLKSQKENSLVVLGAYRRGSVSRWFRESMADVLMKELKLPLFIAHNK